MYRVRSERSDTADNGDTGVRSENDAPMPRLVRTSLSGDTARRTMTGVTAVSASRASKEMGCISRVGTRARARARARDRARIQRSSKLRASFTSIATMRSSICLPAL